MKAVIFLLFAGVSLFISRSEARLSYAPPRTRNANPSFTRYPRLRAVQLAPRVSDHLRLNYSVRAELPNGEWNRLASAIEEALKGFSHHWSNPSGNMSTVNIRGVTFVDDKAAIRWMRYIPTAEGTTTIEISVEIPRVIANATALQIMKEFSKTYLATAVIRDLRFDLRSIWSAGSKLNDATVEMVEFGSMSVTFSDKNVAETAHHTNDSVLWHLVKKAVVAGLARTGNPKELLKNFIKNIFNQA